MKAKLDSRRLLAFSLGFLSVAAESSAQDPSPPPCAETYGRASGDTPLQGLGLVLELVDAGTPDARVRLFGAPAGHAATILVSTSRAESAGPRGSTMYVGPASLSFQGGFDWLGNFEVPLAVLGKLAPGESLYLQGIHVGLLALGDGPLVQLSHGLEISMPLAPEPLSFDDLVPHLPDSPDLASAQGLAEKLQAMLNSPGDSTRIHVEVTATVGLGIEVVDAKVGGKLEVEFLLERTEEGSYELVLAADVAGLAGVSAGTGAEAGAEASSGMGVANIYRFHSAPGAARGILGMLLALQFPGLQPAAWLNESGLREDLLGDAQMHAARLRDAIQLAQANADELERVLFEVLDARLAAAEQNRARIEAQLARAERDYASAPRHLRPRRLADVLFWRTMAAVARVHAVAMRAARIQGERALDLAKAAIEARRSELQEWLAGIARAGRIASAIAQLCPYTSAHYVGWEGRTSNAFEAEAKVGVPCVSMKNVGASLEKELVQTFVLRQENASNQGPARISVVTQLEFAETATAGLLIGGEYATTRAIEREEVFEVGIGQTRWVHGGLSVTADTCLVGAFGAIVAYETGVGRTRSLSLTDDEKPASLDDLAALLSIDGLAEAIGSLEVGFDFMDRRQRNIDFGLAVDVTGNGGGLEVEVEWADQGRVLSRSTTIREGLTALLEGAHQVIDESSGGILTVH